MSCFPIDLRRTQLTDIGLRRINFLSAPAEAVEDLANVCTPATFGRDQVAIFDESYRRAGKLDVGRFSATFDPVDSGLLDQIQDLVVEGHPAGTTARLELYKLNVYGTYGYIHSTTCH